MRRKMLNLLVLSLLTLGCLSGTVALAAAGDMGTDIAQQLGAASGPAGANYGQPTDPRVIFVFIIRVMLGLTTLVLISLNLYAGYLWMTASGNEEQVTKAKTLIRNAVIGLIIVLSAYSITIFAANLARGFSLPPAGVIIGPF